jgi:putative peptidoglycan lipid II flippase
LRRVALIVVAGIAMGLALWAFQIALADWLAGPLLLRLVTVLGIIMLAAVIYFAIVIATGALDRHQLMAAMRRRKRIKDAPPGL